MKRMLKKFPIKLPQRDPAEKRSLLKNLGYGLLFSAAVLLNAVVGLALVCVILVVMFFVPFAIFFVLVLHLLMLIGTFINKPAPSSRI